MNTPVETYEALFNFYLFMVGISLVYAAFRRHKAVVIYWLVIGAFVIFRPLDDAQTLSMVTFGITTFFTYKITHGLWFIYKRVRDKLRK